MEVHGTVHRKGHATVSLAIGLERPDLDFPARKAAEAIEACPRRLRPSELLAVASRPDLSAARRMAVPVQHDPRDLVRRFCRRGCDDVVPAVTARNEHQDENDEKRSHGELSSTTFVGRAPAGDKPVLNQRSIREAKGLDAGKV
jgi:hypothetical protein